MNTENPMTELAEAVTPEAPDSLQAWRDAGTALGLLYGQRAARNEAEDAAFEEALKDAAHAQRKDAGLCTCPSEEELAELRAKFRSPSGTLLDEAAKIPVTTVTVDRATVDALHGMLGRVGDKARAARVEQDATALLMPTFGVVDEVPSAEPTEPGMAMAAAIGNPAAAEDDI